MDIRSTDACMTNHSVGGFFYLFPIPLRKYFAIVSENEIYFQMNANLYK